MTCNTQIVLVTADLRSRVAIRAALRTEPDLSVIGDASDHLGLLALRPQLQPDILLVDAALLAIVLGALDLWPAVRIIVLATIIDKCQVIQALRLGARGIVPKAAPPQELVQSIRNVQANRYWLASDSVAILVQRMRELLENQVEPSYQPHRLTAREHSIVTMIAAGHSNKQIGCELSISERTVKHHLTNIFGKLGISSRLQLAAFAVTHRLAADADSAGGVTGSDAESRRRRKPASAILVGQ